MKYFNRIAFFRQRKRTLRHSVFHRRDLYICMLSAITGIFIGYVAHFLKMLIAFVTNLAFYGRLSFNETSPLFNHLGITSIGVPIIGGLLIGLIARFFNKGVYGHGIPETMETILLQGSTIQKRMLILKPIAAAISIGTGGPFGVEGPIIATGGTLGSAIGQWIKTTPHERQTLLACGVSGAISAAFGAPFGGIFLALELMMFEFRPRSFVPIVLSSVAAALIRFHFMGDSIPFQIPYIIPSLAISSLLNYLFIGFIIGLISVFITYCVHITESLFAKLPIHWMWWPAIGGIGVGIFGYIDPRIFGAGYESINAALSGKIIAISALTLFIYKFFAWLIGVASRTTAGTLAPIFMLGAALGIILESILHYFFPSTHVSIEAAALIGMSALFGGITRAFIASLFITLESTSQFNMMVPVLAGSVTAYIVSLILMQHSILTAELARKGAHIPIEEEHSINKKMAKLVD